MLQPGQMPLNPQGQDPGMMYTMLAGGSPSAAQGPAMAPGQMPMNSPMMNAMQHHQHPMMMDWRQRFADWRAQNPGQGWQGLMQAFAPGGFHGLFGRPQAQPQAPQGFAATTNPQPGRLY